MKWRLHVLVGKVNTPRKIADFIGFDVVVKRLYS
jgi:hypothetical protein